MTAYLDEVREKSVERISLLRSDLADREKALAKMGCIYATGSFGRLEAGADSDLDVFIVIKTYFKEIGGEQVELFRLKETEQIQLKSDLIDAVARAKIAEFDSGGKYLATHKFDDFVKYLGSPEDDYLNTFTGRMLLLLESQVIIGEVSYEKLLKKVVAGYFSDYDENEKSFMPAFLFNDILRMWRTFCVNYEYFRKKGGGDWRIKNLKLKYFRILTCFSAVGHILAKFSEDGTVSPDDVVKTAQLTPVQRLVDLRDGGLLSSSVNRTEIIEESNALIEEYSAFLELNHQEKEAALRDFEANEEQWRRQSHQFGARFATLLELIAGKEPLKNPLYRSIVV